MWRWSSEAPGGVGVGGQGEEGVLEAVRGDLEVTRGRLGEQEAGSGVGVVRAQEHRVAAHLDRRHAGDAEERDLVSTRQGGTDGAAGGEALDVRGSAVGDDAAPPDEND